MFCHSLTDNAHILLPAGQGRICAGKVSFLIPPGVSWPDISDHLLKGAYLWLAKGSLLSGMSSTQRIADAYSSSIPERKPLAASHAFWPTALFVNPNLPAKLPQVFFTWFLCGYFLNYHFQFPLPNAGVSFCLDFLCGKPAALPCKKSKGMVPTITILLLEQNAPFIASHHSMHGPSKSTSPEKPRMSYSSPISRAQSGIMLSSAKKHFVVLVKEEKNQLKDPGYMSTTPIEKV